MLESIIRHFADIVLAILFAAFGTMILAATLILFVGIAIYGV